MEDACSAYSPANLLEPESVASKGLSFIPIVAISQYPSGFILEQPNFDEDDARHVVGLYFKNTFWTHFWNVFYVWPPSTVSERVLFLTPFTQMEGFWKQARRDLSKFGISLPSINEDPSLLVRFNSSHPSRRPKYLGFCKSHQMFKSLTQYVPKISADEDAEGEDFQNFHAALENAVTGSRIKENQEVVSKRAQHWLEEICNLNQAAQFFGLSAVSGRGSISAAGLKDYANYILAKKLTQNCAGIDLNAIAPVDILQPAPYHFNSHVVFYSIDVERWEYGQEITEIGISKLDTNDIANVAPGRNGVNWHSKIGSTHLRIRENAHLRNGTFVYDSAFDFRFGESDWCDENSAIQFLAQCFGKSMHCFGDSSEWRMFVVVGHNIKQDLEYLANARCISNKEPFSNPSCAIIDTQKLYSDLTGSRQQASLANILQKFDILPCALHNAGNDARYTLEALLAMVVHSAAKEDQR